MSTFQKPYQLKNSITIMDYATYLGYIPDKKKSTSFYIVMNRESDSDKIIIGLNKGNNNVDLYKSAYNDNDLGDIIQFCQNRLNGNVDVDKSKKGFYDTIVNLNKFLGIYFTEDFKVKAKANANYIDKKKKLLSSQSQNFNAVPITDYTYFTDKRMISMKTLKSKWFEGTLFNSYFTTPNKHIFTNYGYGTFKDNKLVGLELKTSSKKYNITKDNELGIFISNTKAMDKIDVLFYAESGDDVLSYADLLPNYKNYNPNLNYCFISTGGFLYPEKIEAIFSNLKKIPIKVNHTKFVSITDTDAFGTYSDFYMTAALINHYKTPIHFRKLEKKLYIYSFDDKNYIKEYLNDIKQVIASYNTKIDQTFNQDPKLRYGNYIVLKEFDQNVEIHFPITLSSTQSVFKELLNTLKLNDFFIAHKSNKKDWNEALITLKKNSNQFRNTTTDTSKKKIKHKI